MTTVGTVNPGLMLALVLLILGMVIAIVVLGSLLASARKQACPSGDHLRPRRTR
jgi:hypothetical protein